MKQRQVSTAVFPIWLAIIVQLNIYFLGSGAQNVFCFGSSGCSGIFDPTSTNVEDCCFKHPAGSYLPAGSGTCNNCRSASLFSCKPSLCPRELTKCYCRADNKGTTIKWNFSAHQQLCRNNTINAFNASIAVACGNYLTATVEDCIEGDKSCQNAVLTVEGNSAIDGVGITCSYMNSGTTSEAVGYSKIAVISPPGAPLITGANLTDSHLTLEWNTSRAGGITTSYNVTIKASDTVLRFAVNSNSMNSYSLAAVVPESMLYEITITAVNCAGTSPTTHTLLNLSGSIQTTLVVEVHSSVRLEITWANFLLVAPSYEVSITSNGIKRSGCQEQQCSALKCACVYQLTAFEGIYTVNVISYTSEGILTATGTHITEYSPELAISEVEMKSKSYDAVEIECYFEAPQLHHCMVCCSEINSTSSELTIFNVSTSNGAKTTVTLSGLRANQSYYCVAAAVNTAKANCSTPAAGSLKRLFEFSLQSYLSTSYTNLAAADFSTGSTLSSMENRGLFISALFMSLILLF